MVLDSCRGPLGSVVTVTGGASCVCPALCGRTQSSGPVWVDFFCFVVFWFGLVFSFKEVDIELQII